MTILTNCVFLALDDPNAPPYKYQVYADIVFQIIFTVEMVLKIIALGFLFKPHSYMRDTWNIVFIKSLTYVARFCCGDHGVDKSGHNDEQCFCD